MSEKRVFVVITAAIPKTGLNSLAAKVSYVCLRASRADNLSQMVQQMQKPIVYGIECNIKTSVVDIELTGEYNDNVQEVYVVVATSIPTKKGKNPSRIKIHGVYTDPQKAQQVQMEIQGKKTNIKGEDCMIHSSIVPTKLDKE